MRAIELYEYHETREVTSSPEIVGKIWRDSKIALESTPIYRGMNISETIAYGNPSEPRESANTHNYYTIMMDELPSWKHLPKRSLSWICSTSRYIADDYGRNYRVLPVGNPNIAVASSTDIWFSFSKGLQALTNNLYNLNGFNDLLYNVLEEALTHDVSLTPDPKSLNGIAAIVDKFAQEQLDGLDIGDNLKVTGIKDFLKDVSNKKGFINLMNDIVLNPQVNGINQQRLEFLSGDYDGGREIWFEGPAYFVALDKWDGLFNS